MRCKLVHKVFKNTVVISIIHGYGVERKKTYPFHSNQIPKSKSISIRGGKKNLNYPKTLNPIPTLMMRFSMSHYN
jgi:hypothetical protein